MNLVHDLLAQNASAEVPFTPYFKKKIGKAASQTRS